MTEYKSYLNYIQISLQSDPDLFKNVYQPLKPLNLTGNALICANRCSMNILGNKRENGMTIINNGLLEIEGTGVAKVMGEVQSNINPSQNEDFEFYKIIFFVNQFHKINSIKNDGEMHIIFKSKSSNKYQVNCCLLNHNSHSNEHISEKLIDEYILNNIPSNKKKQTSISYNQKWYLNDLIPPEESYFSYSLQNVLFVLYEKPISISNMFLDKLEKSVMKGKTFNKIIYNNINPDIPLFYTYDQNQNHKNKKVYTIKENFFTEEEQQKSINNEQQNNLSEEEEQQEEYQEEEEEEEQEEFEEEEEEYQEEEDVIKNDLRALINNQNRNNMSPKSVAGRGRTRNYDDITGNTICTKKKGPTDIISLILTIIFVSLICIYVGLMTYKSFRLSNIPLLKDKNFFYNILGKIYQFSLGQYFFAKNYKISLGIHIFILAIFLILFILVVFNIVLNFASKGTNIYFIIVLIISILLLIFDIIRVFLFNSILKL